MCNWVVLIIISMNFRHKIIQLTMCVLVITIFSFESWPECNRPSQHTWIWCLTCAPGHCFRGSLDLEHFLSTKCTRGVICDAEFQALESNSIVARRYMIYTRLEKCGQKFHSYTREVKKLRRFHMLNNNAKKLRIINF